VIIYIYIYTISGRYHLNLTEIMNKEKI